jgi:hypothetical protein
MRDIERLHRPLSNGLEEFGSVDSHFLETSFSRLETHERVEVALVKPIHFSPKGIGLLCFRKVFDTFVKPFAFDPGDRLSETGLNAIYIWLWNAFLGYLQELKSAGVRFLCAWVIGNSIKGVAGGNG